MNKPLILKTRETEEQLVKVVNDAGLPAMILKQILERLFNQLNEIEKNEIKEYQDSLKKEVIDDGDIQE